MNIIGRITLAGLAAATIPAAVAAASGEHHQGNPGNWGPPLEQICDNVDIAAAAALGYNVIVLDNLPNTVSGTQFDDAIFALGGDDTIDGRRGNDLICLGDGDDLARGGRGSDAVFGEAGYDKLQGNPANDYIDGGTEFDSCTGGSGADVQNACEVWVQ